MLGLIQIGPLPKNPSHVSLLAMTRDVRPGGRFTVALRFQMLPGWHIYWQNPGDAGQAPEVHWRLPKGWTAGPLKWPTPERLSAAGVVTYGYQDQTFLFADITVPPTAAAGPASVDAKVDWLVCREGCIPAKADVNLPVRVGAADPRGEPNPAALENAMRSLPKPPEGLRVSARRNQGTITVTINPAQGHADLPANIEFFPADPVVEPSAPQPATKQGRELVLQLKVSSYAPAKFERLRGLLVIPHKSERAVAIDIPLQRS